MIFLLLLIVFVEGRHLQQILITNWQLKILSAPNNYKHIIGIQLPVKIPSNLHLDLLKHKKIKDPFYGTNAIQLKSLSQCYIKYSANITITPDQYSTTDLRLIFEGIDTYSQIKINRQSILHTNNAFKKYELNVKPLMKEGLNLVEVQISPTMIIDNKKQSQNKMPFAYAHTRKPSYQYSWDWAPYINTMGIWKNVYLQNFNDVKINYVWIQILELKQNKALLDFKVDFDITSKKKQPYYFTIKNSQNKLLYSELINHVHMSTVINIMNPILWWPHTVSTPYLYTFLVEVIFDNQVIDTKNISYGIRTTELNQQNKKFSVIINGHNIYCKGANYVPMDMLYPRSLNPFYNYTHLINYAVQSNFNMIRIWGGGHYQSEQFLQLASEKGIMIFYDFMFSDSIYPSTPDFLENIKQQMINQIRKTRNYACLTLWCGNNQILQGIQSWGWKSQNYRKNYHEIFQKLLPQLIATQSPYIPYIESSPVHGVGNNNFRRGGDFHYWGVWAGKKAFNSYQSAVGPFNSEFGTQSFPVWQTICNFTECKNTNYRSQQLLFHEKHTSKLKILSQYISKYGKKSINFELEVYQSGLVQAYGIQIAIKAQRLTKPKSQGTLYWQLNDAWPAISWSSIDYFGRWKPLQYLAKRLFADVITLVSQKSVYVISDKLQAIQTIVRVEIIHFSGKIQSNQTKTIKLNPNEVKLVHKYSSDELKQQINSKLILTEVSFGSDINRYISRTITFLGKQNNLDLTDAILMIQYNFNDNTIKFWSEQFIKNIHIYNTLQYIRFTDNYFDLVPHYSVTVKVLEADLQKLSPTMKYRSYRQIQSKDELKTQIVSAKQ